MRCRFCHPYSPRRRCHWDVGGTRCRDRHRRVRSRQTTETRTLAGRRRLLNNQTPDTHRLNTPIQGTGADGLKLALALLWERRDQAPGAFPVLAVHDEIVVVIS